MASDSRLSNALIGGWSVNWSATLQGWPTDYASLSHRHSPRYRVLRPCRQGTKSKAGTAHRLERKAELDRKPGCVLPALQARSRRHARSYVGCRMCRPFWVRRPWRSRDHDSPDLASSRLDFSLFKDFQLSERFKLQFRSEFFNILNHPNFNAPGFGGNGVVAIGGSNNYTSSNFGEIGSTRDAPYDPRQIQFALKLYF